MRKRTVIAVIAVVAIGVAAFLVSQVIAVIAVVTMGVAAFLVSQLSGPKRETLEWHKRKYFSARNGGGRLEDLFVVHGPDALVQRYWRRKLNRIDFHREALVDGGVLEQQIFVISHRQPRRVAREVWSILLDVFTNDNKLGFTELRPTDTNALTVTAPAEAMQKLEELVRQADVPEDGK
ncbi:MAG: hypothetical protein L0Y58_08405 [Verrucomicrobia subdivision 3 bacterium]|nr:hypothetical protein [Limisphaerales bacterium]